MSDNDETNILDLPTEILSMIFSMTNLTDRVNLSKCCVRFDSVSRMCEMNRHYDFRKCYEIDLVNISAWMEDKVIAHYVLSVDLTGCYWIDTAFIRKFVKRLKNLETLYAVDTAITNTDIRNFLNSNPKLTDIAFTWNGDVPNEKFPNLKSLYIYLPTSKDDLLPNVYKFLQLCENLERLSILSSMASTEGLLLDDPVDESLDLPKLRSLVINLNCRVNVRLVDKILRSSQVQDVWEYSWLRLNCGEFQCDCKPLPPSKVTYICKSCPEDLSFVERAFIFHSNRSVQLEGRPSNFLSLWEKHAKNVRSLAVYPENMQFADIMREGTSLQELNILRESSVFDNFWRSPISEVVCGEHLLKLSVPESILWRTGEVVTINDEFGMPTKRISHYVQGPWEESNMEIIVALCPNIQEFEIGVGIDNPSNSYVGDAFTNTFPQCHGQTLEVISEWKNLRRLAISNVRLASLTFLRKIAEGCSNLAVLELTSLNLKGSGYSMTGLRTVLPLFTKLEDLTLFQPSAWCSLKVLQNLRQTSMKRLALKCQPFCAQALTDFLCNCPGVIFLYFACMVTKVQIKRAESMLNKRFSDRRGLFIRLVDSTKLDSKRLPAIHENDMLYHGPKIATFPHGGSTYIKCD